jgi:hypothetical protein
MAADTIRSQVLNFLSNRTVKDGETVEFSWFIFNAVVEGGRVDLATLDFRKMASYTRDFTVAEEIHRQQMAVLAEAGVQPGWCALWHAAIVSRSYVPGHPHAFLHRTDDLAANKSGWYVGIGDDPLNVNDPSNLFLRSLYELSIQDMRFAPCWLLPLGCVVEFDGEQRHIGRP